MSPSRALEPIYEARQRPEANYRELAPLIYFLPPEAALGRASRHGLSGFCGHQRPFSIGAQT